MNHRHNRLKNLVDKLLHKTKSQQSRNCNNSTGKNILNHKSSNASIPKHFL